MSLTKALKEIADLNNVYPYRMVRDTPTRITYKFKTDEDIDYAVGFYTEEHNEKVWTTGFDSMSSRVGKKVDVEKILNTIFAITKEFYETHKDNVDILLFHADKKRERVYKYYANKIFPTAQINPEGNDPNAFVISMR